MVRVVLSPSLLDLAMDSSRDIARLLEIMAALRTPGTGCPWDLEQTFETIAPYTIEEQFRIQAQGERLGAATWRSFARHAESQQTAKVFESCAVLEEESATFLESLLDSSQR